MKICWPSLLGMALFGITFSAFADTAQNQAAAPTAAVTQATATAPTTVAAPSGPKAGSFSPDHLKDSLGVGLASTPYGGTAMALRWWMDDSTALDLYLSGY